MDKLVDIIALIVGVVGVGYTGSNTSRFSGPASADEPLPDALISALEKYIEYEPRWNSNDEMAWQ